MTFKRRLPLTLLLAALLSVVACTPKQPPVPERNLEQLRMQSQMKALAAEVIKLRESRLEVEQLKINITAMDSLIAVYQTQLAEKAEEPQVEVVAIPRDPDIINLRGNIYVLVREIDSLKEGMQDLETLNDSLEMQIEQLAVQTHTEGQLDQIVPLVPQIATPGNSVPVVAAPALKKEASLTSEPTLPAVTPAKGYRLNTDYRMAYNDALNKYFNNEYLEAIQEFRVLIQREPQGAYADNAQYWIGECYYSMEDFETAIQEFKKVFSFPENNKSDHALFKIAISYQQLGRYEKARDSMNQFILDYPASELSSQAHAFLQGNRGN